MALTRSLGAYDDGTVLAPGIGTTPIDVRKSLSALWASAGVVPGGPSPLVTGTTGFAYQVAGPVPFVTTRGPSDGFAMFTNDGAASVTCPGAPGSGLQRIDIVWVRHPTNTENSDTSSAPIFGVASGTAVSSSPAAPSIPTGALELARNTMTSAATSTASAGNVIAQTAPVAVLRVTAPGLSLVVPTSVPDSGVTLVGGSINLAGAASAHVNGCFTSAFDNYSILIDIATSSAPTDLVLYLRAGGTNLTAAVYMFAYQQIAGSSPTYTFAAAGNMGMVVGRANGTGGGGSKIDLLGPALAQYTKISGAGSDAIIARQFWGTVQNANAYDGFAIWTSPTATLTGKIRVYGYNNG